MVLDFMETITTLTVKSKAKRDQQARAEVPALGFTESTKRLQKYSSMSQL